MLCNERQQSNVEYQVPLVLCFRFTNIGVTCIISMMKILFHFNNLDKLHD